MRARTWAIGATALVTACAANAADFLVNKAADDGSANTLRWAINQSNAINRGASPTLNTITIQPTGRNFVIKPQGDFLPPLVGPVVIHGYRKGGVPAVTLDGSALVPIRTPSACPGATHVYDFSAQHWVTSAVSGTGPNVRGYYGAGLAVHDSHDVEIFDLEIRYFCIGVGTVRSNNVNVHDMLIKDHHGAAGMITTGDNGTAGSTTLSFNNTLKNSILLDNGDGFEFTRGTHDSLLQGNYIALTQPLPVNGNAVEFATSGNNNRVIGNTFTLYSDTAMTVGSGNNHIIQDNDISGNLGPAVSFGGSGHIIQNNKFNNNGAGAITLGGSQQLFQNNQVRNNGGIGVNVNAAGSTRNTISKNSINGNSGLGIDLTPAGVTANDLAASCADGFPDCDTGANNRQNFPVLAATSSWTAAGVTLNGSLPSRPSQIYTIEFFASHAADPSGNGEGEVYLGNGTVTTDATGNITFSASFPGGDPLGDGSTTAVFTATATDSLGNTSEFSGALPLSKL